MKGIINKALQPGAYSEDTYAIMVQKYGGWVRGFVTAMLVSFFFYFILKTSFYNFEYKTNALALSM